MLLEDNVTVVPRLYHDRLQTALQLMVHLPTSPVAEYNREAEGIAK